MKSEELPENKFPWELPFEVPDGYFEKFPERMMQRIEADALPTQGRIIRYNYRLLLAAAAFLLVIAGVFTYRYMMYHNQVKSGEGLVVTAAQSEDTLLLAEISEDIPVEDLAEELHAVVEPGKEAICEYLVDQDVELEEILFEYQ